MNYAAGAQFNTNRRLTRIDSVFPTDTMRLHHRIIDWHRKKNIPVRDADNAVNLSAYLIDPKYLGDSSVTAPKDIPVTHIPSNLPIYQYSRITRNLDTQNYASSGPLSVAASKAVHTVRLGFGAFTTDLMARYRAFKVHNPAEHYAVGKGLSKSWKPRMRLFATAIITGGLLVAAVAFTPHKPTTPAPVSAHPNPAQANSTTTSGTHLKGAASSSQRSSQASSTTNRPDLSQQADLANTSTSKLSQQQLISNPINTAPTNITPPTSITTPPVSTTPVPTPTTSQPIDDIVTPVLSPVTNTVNDVLSTQITVNVPSLTDQTNEPLVEITH
jgi:hypothetical protein